jgi:hypothetical protein
MQKINEITYDNTEMFTFVESVFSSDEQLDDIMHDERGNSTHFDLARGLVSRCHIVHYKQNTPDDLLRERDAVIFNFHHALFDFPSIQIFSHDLDQAYMTGQLLGDNGTDLRYIDCRFSHIFFSAAS